MSKKSLYLKYRPLQLEDVVGQNFIVETLKKSSLTDNFAHAYLFSGNHGCGKTTTARLVASLVNCSNVKDGVVCGKCRACKTITSCSSIDIVEIDGASNRGIDNIKSIIESSKWSPSELKKKIIIVDECHQLSKEAISALLKTLEEPSSSVIFILCTTDIDKILPTILSRCQRFNFAKINSKEITNRLMHIARKENIKLDAKAGYMLAQMARGSMRDAIGYLDQIATVANGKDILEVHVSKYFGGIDRRAVYNVVNAIVNCDVCSILNKINDMVMASLDIKKIIYEISEIFRNTMVVKIQKDTKSMVDLPDFELERIHEIGKKITVPQLIKLSHLFSDVDRKISFNINERWIIESTLINCAYYLSKKK